eukprot:CAMPEP_0174262290 /NCGR_PEP_ID=MMETSP0439-20130205/12891_1 /TAXON_ID=0 /ORGANISM="Stereomyxa ramosa, Strain Chinc5" /LENGTH=287 /DNA_ID=CAMNT_0015346981 /DNA_START=17 /DNA_END=880 /DNA_ORIENTATION=-
MDEDKEAKVDKRKYVVFDGINFPPICSVESLTWLRDTFVPRKGDIFIASYPKSGTTWAMHMLNQLITKGDSSFDNIENVVPWIETIRGQQRIPELEESEYRLFKTHMSFPHLPLPENNPDAKYLYLIRDPMDVVVSFFYHSKGFGYPGELPDFFDKFVEGKCVFGSWFEHTKGFIERKQADNVMVVLFEDLKDDLRSCIDTIVQFCGFDISPDEIDSIMPKFSFEFMKENASKFDYSWNEYRQDEATFFRKGEKGTGLQELNQKQRAKIKEMYLQLPLELYPYDHYK